MKIDNNKISVKHKNGIRDFAFGNLEIEMIGYWKNENN